MRLTPFRFRSSSGPDSDETSIPADVEIYHLTPESRVDESDGEAFTTDTPITVQNLVPVLEELDTPVTVDEVTDQLVHPSNAVDVEAWGDIHEQLYQDELPALCDAGLVDFDTTRGTVELSDDQEASSSRDVLTVRTVATAVSVGLVAALLLLVPATVATAASVGLLTVGVLAYALILFPITP